MKTITKSEFNNLVNEHGLDKAIEIVRSRLGKEYTNLTIRFDEHDQLIIKKLKKRWKKNESPYRQSLVQERLERRTKRKALRKKRACKLKSVC